VKFLLDHDVPDEVGKVLTHKGYEVELEDRVVRMSGR
jgi:hypothetical protein